MRRTVRVLGTVFLMVALSAGVALAASPLIITGTHGDDQIKGTKKAEEVRGLGGEDEIVDGLGKDTVMAAQARTT